MRRGKAEVARRRQAALARRKSELEDLSSDNSRILRDYMTFHSAVAKAVVRERKVKLAMRDIANLERALAAKPAAV